MNCSKDLSVEQYFKDLPADLRNTLQAVRDVLRSALPQATERISYGMPSFDQHGIVVWYAAAKQHIGLYPKANAVKVFADRLREYDCSKGTIRIPLNKALPRQLIKDIARFRLQENMLALELKAAKKSSKKSSKKSAATSVKKVAKSSAAKPAKKTVAKSSGVSKEAATESSKASSTSRVAKKASSVTKRRSPKA